MNAGEFARRRARIEREHFRSKGYAARALAALVREAGAHLVVIGGRHMGWRMQNGQVVCKKRSYHTEQDANDAMEGVQAMRMTERTPSRVYLCDHCGAWHMTSKAKAN